KCALIGKAYIFLSSSKISTVLRLLSCTKQPGYLRTGEGFFGGVNPKNIKYVLSLYRCHPQTLIALPVQVTEIIPQFKIVPGDILRNILNTGVRMGEFIVLVLG